MKPPKPTNKALIVVADRALAGSDLLCTHARAELLDAIAYILPDARLAEAAQTEAFMLREADARQLQLTEMLKEAAR
jgi:hypothetical protein